MCGASADAEIFKLTKRNQPILPIRNFSNLAIRRGQRPTGR